MEKPRGQTRATSWHPPWLQERSQPYSPHVPGGSETRTGGSAGHRCPPTPALRCDTRSPNPPGSAPPTPCQGWGPRRGVLRGEVTRSDVSRQGSPGGGGAGPQRGRERGGTWAGDALLSIRARAEVGGDAQAAAAAEGAERCRERGPVDVRRAGTPPHTPNDPPPTHTPPPRARTHAGCTARCPGTASTRGNIRCRSPRSRRGAPRGACAADERLRPPCPEPPGSPGWGGGGSSSQRGALRPREGEDGGGPTGAVTTCSWPPRPQEGSRDPGARGEPGCSVTPRQGGRQRERTVPRLTQTPSAGWNVPWQEMGSGTRMRGVGPLRG